jgi:DNA-binding Lrp family transcriptional regulator
MPDKRICKAVLIDERILQSIEDNPGITIEEMSDKIEISQSTIGIHIRNLNIAGLIQIQETYPRRFFLHDSNQVKCQSCGLIWDITQANPRGTSKRKFAVCPSCGKTNYFRGVRILPSRETKKRAPPLSVMTKRNALEIGIKYLRIAVQNVEDDGDIARALKVLEKMKESLK